MSLHSSVLKQEDGAVLYRTKLHAIGIPRLKYTVYDPFERVVLVAKQRHSIMQECYSLQQEQSAAGEISSRDRSWEIALVNAATFTVDQTESKLIHNRASFSVRKANKTFGTIRSESLCWTVSFESDGAPALLLPALSIIHGRFINEG